MHFSFVIFSFSYLALSNKLDSLFSYWGYLTYIALNTILFLLCGYGETGRRVRLRGVWLVLVSSSLTSHTNWYNLVYGEIFYFPTSQSAISIALIPSYVYSSCLVRASMILSYASLIDNNGLYSLSKVAGLSMYSATCI